MAEQERFKVVATETIQREYVVLALDDKDARKRLHLHWKDAEMLREGIVTQADGHDKVTSRQVGEITRIAKRQEGSPLTAGGRRGGTGASAEG